MIIISSRSFWIQLDFFQPLPTQFYHNFYKIPPPQKKTHPNPTPPNCFDAFQNEGWLFLKVTEHTLPGRVLQLVWNKKNNVERAVLGFRMCCRPPTQEVATNCYFLRGHAGQACFLPEIGPFWSRKKLYHFLETSFEFSLCLVLITTRHKTKKLFMDHLFSVEGSPFHVSYAHWPHWNIDCT